VQFVARIERSEIRGLPCDIEWLQKPAPPSPDFAALNPGYGLCAVGGRGTLIAIRLFTYRLFTYLLQSTGRPRGSV
jgi:hypothetical protein